MYLRLLFLHHHHRPLLLTSFSSSSSVPSPRPPPFLLLVLHLHHHLLLLLFLLLLLLLSLLLTIYCNVGQGRKYYEINTKSQIKSLIIPLSIQLATLTWYKKLFFQFLAPLYPLSHILTFNNPYKIPYKPFFSVGSKFYGFLLKQRVLNSCLVYFCAG